LRQDRPARPPVSQSVPGIPISRKPKAEPRQARQGRVTQAGRRRDVTRHRQKSERTEKFRRELSRGSRLDVARLRGNGIKEDAEERRGGGDRARPKPKVRRFGICHLSFDLRFAARRDFRRASRLFRIVLVVVSSLTCSGFIRDYFRRVALPVKPVNLPRATRRQRQIR